LALKEWQTKGILLRRKIMASLAEIRAKLQTSQQGNSAGGDNAIYPHWNIQEGQTATVRFIADGDPNNIFFWIERAMIKLPFAGIKGETNSRPTTVQVPCMEMWNETCPVLTEVRPWFKDKSLEELGKKYWKKKSYLYQGFVVESKYQEEGKIPENPIRRFIIGSQIHNIIKNALMDNEIEELPTDAVRGLDFKIVKTTKGGYADYSTSSWSRRERALTETEQAALKQFGPFSLKDYLPKKPTETELKVIKEMFEASVDGEAFDSDRWGQYYKPAGYSVTPATEKTEKVQVADDDETTPVAVKSSRKAAVVESDSSAQNGPSKAQDILAAIRSRSKS
jgi:hypothetical protein